MPVSGVSTSVGSYPVPTMASSADIATELKSKIYYGDRQSFIAALQNAIAAGINIDVEIDSDRNTPLSYALNQSQLSIAEYLLEMGADHTVTDDRGNTALMMLIHHYGENEYNGETTPDTFLALATKLINYEADINRSNKRNETAAMVALTSNKGDDVAMSLLTLMEPKGIKLYQYDADGHSLMSKAITFTNGTDVVKKIIDMGFDVNDFSTLGHPHIERLLGDKESIAYYQFQYTPLYFAIVKNDYHKVKLLLDEGANEEGISMWDINGLGGRKAITPLRLAEKIGNQNILKLLIERGFKDSWSASRWFSCDSDDSSTVSLDDIEDYQDLIVDSSDSD